MANKRYDFNISIQDRGPFPAWLFPQGNPLEGHVIIKDDGSIQNLGIANVKFDSWKGDLTLTDSRSGEKVEFKVNKFLELVGVPIVEQPEPEPEPKQPDEPEPDDETPITPASSSAQSPSSDGHGDSSGGCSTGSFTATYEYSCPDNLIRITKLEGKGPLYKFYNRNGKELVKTVEPDAQGNSNLPIGFADAGISYIGEDGNKHLYLLIESCGCCLEIDITCPGDGPTSTTPSPTSTTPSPTSTTPSPTSTTPSPTSTTSTTPCCPPMGKWYWDPDKSPGSGASGPTGPTGPTGSTGDGYDDYTLVNIDPMMGVASFAPGTYDIDTLSYIPTNKSRLEITANGETKYYYPDNSLPGFIIQSDVVWTLGVQNVTEYSSDYYPEPDSGVSGGGGKTGSQGQTGLEKETQGKKESETEAGLAAAIAEIKKKEEEKRIAEQDAAAAQRQYDYEQELAAAERARIHRERIAAEAEAQRLKDEAKVAAEEEKARIKREQDAAAAKAEKLKREQARADAKREQYERDQKAIIDAKRRAAQQASEAAAQIFQAEQERLAREAEEARKNEDYELAQKTEKDKVRLEDTQKKPQTEVPTESVATEKINSLLESVLPTINTSLDITGISEIAPPYPDEGYKKAVTLISPIHFVMSKHWPVRKTGDTVNFIDKNGVRQTRRITGYEDLDGVDISVGILDAAVVDTAIYPVPAPRADGDYNYILGDAYVLAIDQERKAIPRKVYFMPGVAGKYPKTVSIFNAIPGDYGTDEKLVSGDSSGPTFIYTNNAPILIETHTSNTGGPFYGDFVTQRKINTAMASLSQKTGADNFFLQTVDIIEAIDLPAANPVVAAATTAAASETAVTTTTNPDNPFEGTMPVMATTTVTTRPPPVVDGGITTAFPLAPAVTTTSAPPTTNQYEPDNTYTSSSVFSPHYMYSISGKGVYVTTYEEHLRLQQLGWLHTPPIKSITSGDASDTPVSNTTTTPAYTTTNPTYTTPGGYFAYNKITEQNDSGLFNNPQNPIAPSFISVTSEDGGVYRIAAWDAPPAGVGGDQGVAGDQGVPGSDPDLTVEVTPVKGGLTPAQQNNFNRRLADLDRDIGELTTDINELQDRIDEAKTRGSGMELRTSQAFDELFDEQQELRQQRISKREEKDAIKEEMDKLSSGVGPEIPGTGEVDTETDNSNESEEKKFNDIYQELADAGQPSLDTDGNAQPFKGMVVEYKGKCYKIETEEDVQKVLQGVEPHGPGGPLCKHPPGPGWTECPCCTSSTPPPPTSTTPSPTSTTPSPTSTTPSPTSTTPSPTSTTSTTPCPKCCPPKGLWWFKEDDIKEVGGPGDVNENWGNIFIELTLREGQSDEKFIDETSEQANGALGDDLKRVWKADPKTGLVLKDTTEVSGVDWEECLPPDKSDGRCFKVVDPIAVLQNIQRSPAELVAEASPAGEVGEEIEIGDQGGGWEYCECCPRGDDGTTSTSTTPLPTSTTSTTPQPTTTTTTTSTSTTSTTPCCVPECSPPALKLGMWFWDDDLHNYLTPYNGVAEDGGVFWEGPEFEGNNQLERDIAGALLADDKFKANQLLLQVDPMSRPGLIRRLTEWMMEYSDEDKRRCFEIHNAEWVNQHKDTRPSDDVAGGKDINGDGEPDEGEGWIKCECCPCCPPTDCDLCWYYKEKWDNVFVDLEMVKFTPGIKEEIIQVQPGRWVIIDGQRVWRPPVNRVKRERDPDRDIFEFDVEEGTVIKYCCSDPPFVLDGFVDDEIEAAFKKGKEASDVRKALPEVLDEANRELQDLIIKPVSEGGGGGDINNIRADLREEAEAEIGNALDHIRIADFDLNNAALDFEVVRGNLAGVRHQIIRGIELRRGGDGTITDREREVIAEVLLREQRGQEDNRDAERDGPEGRETPQWDRPAWLKDILDDQIFPGQANELVDALVAIDEGLQREQLIENDENWTGPATGNELTPDDIKDGNKLDFNAKDALENVAKNFDEDCREACRPVCFEIIDAEFVNNNPQLNPAIDVLSHVNDIAINPQNEDKPAKLRTKDLEPEDKGLGWKMCECCPCPPPIITTIPGPDPQPQIPPITEEPIILIPPPPPPPTTTPTPTTTPRVDTTTTTPTPTTTPTLTTPLLPTTLCPPESRGGPRCNVLEF